jgi:ATP-binding protein involved in chromosome partitioning
MVRALRFSKKVIKYSKFKNPVESIVLQKEIESKLAEYQDPYLNTDFITAKSVKRITVLPDQILIDLVLGYPHLRVQDEIITQLKKLLDPISSGKKLDISLTSRIDAHAGKQGLPSLPQVKNIIAVASGKGGVGKSTVAINLALALQKEGAEVGILDADIYGPSQPTMLGATGERPFLNGKLLQPVKRHGIQSMSIGYLIEENAAMVWRGPMIGKAMQQLLHDTSWEALDYLIVDLPPGTGDIQLTLCQKIPVSGALIVTTPQDLALSDVRRACEMFNKLNVPVLGVVENMSSYHCPQCGHEEKIFGEGGGLKLSQEYGLAMLLSIPLDIRIREMTDSGRPPVVQEPEGREAKLFYGLARKIAAALSLQAKDYSAKFPKIVVQPQAK